MKKLFSVLLFAVSLYTFSQTPGLIIRDGNNNIPPLVKSAVLDPNQDGYVSANSTGFTTTDLGAANEIPYIGTSIIFPESTGDLQRGPTGGFSDFAPDANGKSFYTYFDGTNIYFRIRIADIVAGAKAYSVLIDSDTLFETLDPTYTAKNPGFEYEVVVQTGFKIAVYNVNDGINCTSVWENSLPQYYQTALALTANNGNPDYFLDFYVPLTSFTGAGAITSIVPLRFQIASVMAPQPSLCGPNSDSYPPQNINAQPKCTPAQIADGTCPTEPCTPAPVVNSPISDTATSITGTWTKTAFSSQTNAVIEVFVNDILRGTVNATSGTPWSISVSGLVTGDKVTATAKATNETKCDISNKVRVSSCTAQNTSACPNTICITSKGMEATGIAGSTITVYKLNPDGSFTSIYSGTVDILGNWSWNGGTGGGNNICQTGANNSIADGTYYLVQVEPGKCPSACTGYSCVGGTSTTSPTISTDPITIYTNTITGTAPAGSTVRLMLNNTQIAFTTATATGTYSFGNITSYFAQVGDTFSINAQSTAVGSCISSPPITKKVSCIILSPIINKDTNGNITVGTKITGTSTEIGATITVYNNATNAIIGTTTVLTNNTWTLDTPLAAASTSYYAIASTTCGNSNKSNIVTAITGTSISRCGTITGPIIDNVTSVSGTLATAVANTTVNLYIDSYPIGSITTSTTSWTIPVNTTVFNVLYGGGILTIGITEPSKTEIICAASVTVSCSRPSIPITDNFVYSANLGGTVNIIVQNSQTGVLYTIEKADGSDFGISSFGNGGSLTLTSATINFTGSEIFYVRAFSLYSSSCSASSIAFRISTSCYKPAQTSGTPLITNHGITALGRAGADNSNWPMERKGAWMALEAKTKGFVLNRIASAPANIGVAPNYDTYLDEPVDSSGNAVILNPIVGMMFYDTRSDCLKINIDGTRASWKCFNTQTCPD